MLYTYRLEALKSANVGVFIYLLSVYGTVQYIENLWNVVPIAAGSWVGTYYTLLWERRAAAQQRKQIKKNGKRA
jgi:hypothetical protein